MYSYKELCCSVETSENGISLKLETSFIDNWVSSLKNLIESISSPKNSNLIGWSLSIGNISIIYPRTAYSPVDVTSESRVYPSLSKNDKSSSLS